MNNMSQKVITLDYSLFKDTKEGQMIESTEGKTPLVFLSGIGSMIPEFENNVVNLNAGDAFSFPIKSENAYGNRTEEAIIDLPINIFMQDGKLADQVVTGNLLPLQDDKGNVIPSTVVSINEETITMDANHPLAGQDLHVTGNIVEVREATDKEIDLGQVQGSGCCNEC